LSSLADKDSLSAAAQAHRLAQVNDEAFRGKRSPSGSAPRPPDDDFRVGVCLAVAAGLLYGTMFVPLGAWGDRVEERGAIFDRETTGNVSTALRYFFSQACGTFLLSFGAFAAYCARSGKRAAMVPPEAALPCVASGAMWGVGCVGGVLATAGLGNSVGATLVVNSALLVNSAWSVLYFKEIEGAANLRCFYGGCVLSVGGSVLISLSKG
jgi:hypothetical protein